ncbi:acyltransferase [Weissella confusa]|uniref:acyltransferase n=1 Tax=Weissella confusa TaxID=1583 RepID=UPI0018F1263B|nr:acyltransferase family protein [Weissella confusa]MBJ7670814.1 acyltransferase family protein [Weissella confusa]
MQRNIGIDIAKIAAMFGVIVIHNLGQGGLLYSPDLTMTKFIVLWILENVGIVAVNIFALTTGYLMINKKIKFIRIWEVAMQASFWAPAMAIILFATGLVNPTLDMVVHSVLPIIFKQYWYVNAYIGAMLFAPFINSAFEKLSQKFLLKVLALVIIVSITIGFIGKLFLSGGYSSLWLLTLYAIGGFIRKYIDITKINKRSMLFVAMSMIIVSTLGDVTVYKLGIGAVALPHLLSYISPLVFVQSLAVFVLFLKIKIHSNRLTEAIVFVAPLTFGAYLIDTSIFYNYLDKKFEWLLDYNLVVVVLLLIIISIGMFLGFIILEYVRKSLFDRLHINLFLEKTYFFVSGLLDNFLDKLVYAFVK